MVHEQSSSSTAIKSSVKAKAAAVQRSRATRTWTENDQEVSDGFSTRRNIWNTVTSCTKEQNLGPTAGTTAVLWYPAILFPGALVSPGLLASGLPVVFVFCPWCCSESEDSVNNSRIQHSNCLWYMFVFSLYIESISGTVAMQSVL